ncbi:MAG: hypothetical protein COA78_05695 [Blastopirellula sp.]|nr:MAG: hypothetical protein COA78_05695 [Blastopirellula sp.]
MNSPLDHPWITARIPFINKDSIRVCMKNAAVMIDGESPPDWIVVLDSRGRMDHSQTRVVVAEQTTMDFELDAGNSPQTTILTDEQSSKLSEILSQIDVDTDLDARCYVCDGNPCVVTVINGKDKWVNFGEFNLAGLSPSNRIKPGPQIGVLLNAMSRGFTI